MSKLDYRLTKLFRDQGTRAPMRVESKLSEIFHENTKLTPLSSRVFGQQIAAFTSSKMLKKMVEQPYKI